MMCRSANRRPAFTLLEILLASAIAFLLMAALYTAMNIQLQFAKAGRDVVEQGNLVRNIVARIERDINASLGPPSAQAVANAINSPANTSGTAGAATGSTTGNSTGATGSANAGAGTGTGSTGAGGGAGSGSGSNQNQNDPSAMILFNLGMQGDATHLNIFASRVPREAATAQTTNGADPSSAFGISDLRRISYWIVDGAGLARQEVIPITSDDAMNSVPPNVPNEANYVIAEEIKGITFSYFDGTSWQDTWDGTQPGEDMQSPTGPPIAVAVTLSIALPGVPDVKQFRHVVFIPTANGPGQPATQNTNAANSGPSNM